jgi:DNA repair photolyase
MSEQFSQVISASSSNLIHFPIRGVPSERRQLNNQKIPTPKSDKIFKLVEKLKRASKYTSQFDYETYRRLELRAGLRQPSGEITFNTTFKLTNTRQRHYSFEIDIYGNPLPIPIDISDVWKILYTVFETDQNSEWRAILEKRTPLRIGSMSDSFVFIDQRYGVTKEFLKILDHYKYPYIILTRSDLVAHDDYMKILNPKLCSVCMSISSINDEMNRIIEKEAPSAKRRLLALQKLAQNGFLTSVQLNPFFPIYADGYFSDPNFDKNRMPKPFHYSSFEMIDEIASYGARSIFAEMARLSPLRLNEIEKAFGRDLKNFYKSKSNKNDRNFYYSESEMRAYYENMSSHCAKNSIEFTSAQST